MKKGNREYTLEEIHYLNSNPNVVMVKYNRCVEYTDEFKKWAVEMSKKNPHLSAIQIFELAGFDRRIINSKNARDRIAYWRTSINNTKKDIKTNINIEKNLNEENNLMLKTLLSKFERLITILNNKIWK